MKPEELGRIMSRSMGIIFFLVGSISLIDHFFMLWTAGNSLPESGWSNYEPIEETGPEEDNPSMSYLHDSCAIVSSSFFSPVGSGLLILFGLVLVFLPGPNGRFIACGKSE